MQVLRLTLAILLGLASAVGTSSAATNSAPEMQLNAFVQLPDGSASGFLKYKGQHQGITFYALVTDIGSGIPSQDFCLYACKEGKCQPVVSLPRLQHRGYECSAEADTLNVYVIKRYTDKKPENQELLRSIKLPVLAQSYSQREAGQSDGSDNLSAALAADRAFPAAGAELGRASQLTTQRRKL